jgi:hypothetical protein
MPKRRTYFMPRRKEPNRYSRLLFQKHNIKVWAKPVAHQWELTIKYPNGTKKIIHGRDLLKLTENAIKMVFNDYRFTKKSRNSGGATVVSLSETDIRRLLLLMPSTKEHEYLRNKLLVTLKKIERLLNYRRKGQNEITQDIYKTAKVVARQAKSRKRI